jgi:membrane protein required for colicin V production
MNLADLVILIVLLIGFTAGLARGFVRGLMGLVGLVLAVILAAGSYERLAEYAPSFIPGDRGAEIVSFALIFIVVIVLVTIAARIIAKGLRLAALGWLDRLAGSALGVVMAAVVMGMFLLITVMAGFEEEKLLVESVMAPRVLRVTDVVVGLLPKEPRKDIEEYYGRLRDQWDSAREKQKNEEEEKAVMLPGGHATGELPPYA